MRLVRKHDHIEITMEEAAQAIGEWVNRKRVDSDLKPLNFREEGRLPCGAPVPLLVIRRDLANPVLIDGFLLEIERPPLDEE